jgi:D-alanine-D-alanine ligase
MKTNIAVFFGGRSVEHDVSIVTGLQALENIDNEAHNAFAVYLARDGRWYIGDALRDVETYKRFDAIKDGLKTVALSGVSGRGLVYHERKGGLFGGGAKEVVLPVDAALLCMHGAHGEDGSLQGMLEMSDIAYTSAPVGASAAGMDKALMKRVFLGCGFPVAEYIDFTREAYAADEGAVHEDILQRIGFPLFVKPACLGSSIGITHVKEAAALKDAIALALAYDRRVVVEKAVPNAMEINCSVLGYGADCRASLCEMPQLPADSAEFNTFDTKYIQQGKGSGRAIPAPIPGDMTARIQALACDVFTKMDCKGVVRIDFLVNRETQGVFINEINTIPGSLSFYLWEPAGLRYPALIDELIAIAIRARADKKRNTYAYDSAILDKVRKGQGLKGAKGGKHGK